MKALIISENQEFVSNVKRILEKDSFDIIVYKWIIKALDNIEEIQPQVIILISDEFSRHWKTLASYVESGIGGQGVRVFLFNKTCLSDDEEKKASIFDNLFVIDNLDYGKFEGLLGGKAEIEEEGFADVADFQEEAPVLADEPTVIAESSEEAESDKNPDQIIITNPVSGKFSFGKIISQSQKSLSCKMDSWENFDGGLYLDYISFTRDGQIITCPGKVSGYESSEKRLSLTLEL